MKGGILAGITYKTISLVCTAIVLTMIATAMIGESRARSLGTTVSNVGGDATNIVIVDMIPTFFENAFPSDSAAAKKG